MQDRVFYSLCFGFILGVLLRSFVAINLYFNILFTLISLVLVFFFYFISKNNWCIIFSGFISALCLGIFIFSWGDIPPPSFLESKVDEKIVLKGGIVDEPIFSESSQKLVVEIEDEKVKVLANVSQGYIYKYGDQIELFGKLEKPENFITDQGKEFDYINYLKKDNIFYIMNYPETEILSRGNGNFIKNNLFIFKQKFLEKINVNIRNPENLLMGGLILGEKASFSEDLRKSFVDTGTIHIVALSGYNITIVAEYFMKLFSFLSKIIATWMGFLSIVLFILMTGASSTAIRAGIMSVLSLYARASGRNYDVARALTLAGVFMVLFNPLILVYDVSFQLSFIATIAVIFLSPRLEKYFMWVTKKFGLRDIICVTFSAYIFVLPFILYKMGNLSLVALPANIFILPFIPFTMIMGFVTGFFGLIWWVLAVPFGYLSYLFLHYELGVISFFSHIPFASITFSNFPLWMTLLIYSYFIYKLFGGVIKKFFTEPF
jgi:competence protein ComEC